MLVNSASNSQHASLLETSIPCHFVEAVTLQMLDVRFINRLCTNIFKSMALCHFAIACIFYCFSAFFIQYEIVVNSLLVHQNCGVDGSIAFYSKVLKLVCRQHFVCDCFCAINTLC